MAMARAHLPHLDLDSGSWRTWSMTSLGAMFQMVLRFSLQIYFAFVFAFALLAGVGLASSLLCLVSLLRRFYDAAVCNSCLPRDRSRTIFSYAQLLCLSILFSSVLSSIDHGGLHFTMLARISACSSSSRLPFITETGLLRFPYSIRVRGKTSDCVLLSRPRSSALALCSRRQNQCPDRMRGV